MSRTEIVGYIALVVLAASYLYYINAGCAAPLHTGVMTWHGKECVK